MLRPRITPCLLLDNGDLIKTVNFEPSKYIGDPLNAVRIFNEKHVDELIVLDVTATTEGREPDYHLISSMAAECRMPLCYGGGIASPDQVARLVGLGVEKVALSSIAMADPGVVTRAVQMVGSQSVATVLDVRKTCNGYEVMTHRGSRQTDVDPITAAQRMQDAGAGEIVINSIDGDGTMAGYDLDLAESVYAAIHIPMTYVGGAGTLDHLKDLFQRVGIVGAGAGSLFVFKGVYRAVLINYPGDAEKEALLEKSDTGR